MKSTRTYSVILALVLNVLGASAFAYDTKVMPGSACNPESGSQADTFTTWWDYISNGDSVNAHVNCPVVRDRAYNANGTEFAYAYVASSNSKTLTCILYSYSSTGGFIASDSESTTSNSAVSLYLDVSASGSAGYYDIHCDLPPGGRVFGYRVGEFEPTDVNN